MVLRSGTTQPVSQERHLKWPLVPTHTHTHTQRHRQAGRHTRKSIPFETSPLACKLLIHKSTKLTEVDFLECVHLCLVSGYRAALCFKVLFS